MTFLHDLDLFKHSSQFLGLQMSNFNFETIVKFVFPLAFQHNIPNCSTAKTRKATLNTKQKIEDDGEGRGGIY